MLKNELAYYVAGIILKNLVGEKQNLILFWILLTLLKVGTYLDGFLKLYFSIPVFPLLYFN